MLHSRQWTWLVLSWPPHTCVLSWCPPSVKPEPLAPKPGAQCGALYPAQISIGDLKLRACKAMGLEEGDVRIWDYWNESRHASLEGRLDDTAQAAKLFDSQDILLEEKVGWHSARAGWPHTANFQVPAVPLCTNICRIECCRHTTSW